MTHSLTFTITMQGNTDVMEQFARRIGEGIGSVVQTVAIQPEQSLMPDLISANEYAKKVGKTARTIRELCKAGKLKYELKGRQYFVHVNQI
jgi:hypothetical protein